MSTVVSEHPTGKLRFLGGRLQQEWATEESIEPKYTEEQERSQTIILQASTMSFSWRDVPSDGDEPGERERFPCQRPGCSARGGNSFFMEDRGRMWSLCKKHFDEAMNRPREESAQ